MNDITKQLEALLFYTGEPMARDELSKILGIKKEELEAAIDEIKGIYKDRGVSVVDSGSKIALVTGKDNADIIEKYRKEQLKGEIGNAGAETLAIISYMGPVSRATIDYIRGVNSQFIVRKLLIRGLIERAETGEDKRTPKYTLSINSLSHLGVKNKKDLPEYENVKTKLQDLLNQRQESLNKSEE